MILKRRLGFILNRIEAHPFLSVFIFSLGLRLLLVAGGFRDFWGDAHHNLIMSQLTLENDFVYTDFKDRHLTWLPLFRYWGSLIAFLTGSKNLVLFNCANTLIGASVATLGAWFLHRVSNIRLTLYGGFTISILPYLMVFSFVNMGEMLGSLLLLGWFISAIEKRYKLLILCTFLAVLTRYELIFLITIGGLALLYQGKKTAVFYSGLGVISGLSLWSWWSWFKTGQPLNWFIMRLNSTTSNADFYESVNVISEHILIPLASILQAFPLILFFIWFRNSRNQKTPNWLFLAGTITLSHWLFFMVAQTRIFSYPDPRYLVLSLPLAVIWFYGLWERGYFRAYVQPRKAIILLTLTLPLLIVPYFRQYNINNRIELGKWAKIHLNDSTQIWSDLAVSIVASEKDYDQFISSEKLIPKEMRFSPEEENRIYTMIDSLSIGYLFTYEASYSYPNTYWPKLNHHQPFEWHDLSFIPIYIYSLPKENSPALYRLLREQFESRNQPAIWKIYHSKDLDN